MNAILLAIGHEQAQEKVNIFNLGTDQVCEVNDSIGWISAHLDLAPELRYSGGERGWIGDNPLILLDCRKIRSLGWNPQLTIADGIMRTIQYLEANPWVLEPK